MSKPTEKPQAEHTPTPLEWFAFEGGRNEVRAGDRWAPVGESTLVAITLDRDTAEAMLEARKEGEGSCPTE